MSISSHAKRVMVFALILFIGAFSTASHALRWDALCLNEDEAAQAYNTYAVLTTGYDEYGQVPLRYLSFGEHKLPLTGMLSSAFIAVMGLGDLSTRLPVLLLGSLMPLFFFGAVYHMTGSRLASLIAAGFASTNMWLITLSRHQHEAVVLVVIVLLILKKLYEPLEKQPNIARSMISMGLLLFMGLYTYHSAKIIVPILGLAWIVYVRKRTLIMRFAILTVLVSCLMFLSTELIQPTNRVGSLSYFTSPVFTHEIEEGRRLGGSALYYNKIVYGVHRLITRTTQYLSPTFLLERSDPNPRYGSAQVPLLTITTYLLAVMGFIVAWRMQSPGRYMLPILLLVGALPAALALPESSATRSLVMIVPILISASIAMYRLTQYAQKLSGVNAFVAYGVLLLLIGAHLFQFTTASYQYLNNYLQNPNTARAWQCGAKEMAEYVWTRYDEYKKIVITNAYGQPYIYLLLYGSYPPAWYQPQARIKEYNEYGFWEHDGFDKFVFEKPLQFMDSPDTLFIMTPDEARANMLPTETLRPIYDKFGTIRYYASE